MRKFPAAALAVLISAAAFAKVKCDTAPSVVGERIAPWQEGQLDIHFINTPATGECTFVIMPDGTQLLIDAAGNELPTGSVGGRTTNVQIRQRWERSDVPMRIGEFIGIYLRECMEWTGNDGIDYYVLTHFHDDHFGKIKGMPVSSKSDSYRLQSFVEILDDFKVGTLLDRGWPDYNYPFDMQKVAANADEVSNYVTAVKWHVANTGLDAQRFRAGVSDQIRPLRNRSACRGFKVQNIAVNGQVWTGKGRKVVDTFPSADEIECANPRKIANGDKCPAENANSCVMRISYGKFDFFQGGDMQYNGLSDFEWKNIETAAARACGPVEVMKADHHGTSSTNGSGFKDKAWAMKYLDPQCWIVNSWTDGHPRQETFENVTSYCKDIDVFITNTCESQSRYKGYAEHFKGGNGHIVVRVNPDSSYYVYVLADNEQPMTVRSVAGPYTSR